MLRSVLLPLLSFLLQSLQLCSLTLLREPAELISFVLFKSESLVEVYLLQCLVDFTGLYVGETLTLPMLLYFETKALCNCGLPGLEDLDAALLLVERLEFCEHGPLPRSQLLLVDLLEPLVVEIKLLPHLLKVEIQKRARVLRFLLSRVELPGCGLLERCRLHQSCRSSRHRVVGLEPHVLLSGVHLATFRHRCSDIR